MPPPPVHADRITRTSLSTRSFVGRALCPGRRVTRIGARDVRRPESRRRSAPAWTVVGLPERGWTMPQPLDAKRLLETTRHLTDAGRSQARQLGTELASQGRLASEQLSAAVDELVNRP